MKKKAASKVGGKTTQEKAKTKASRTPSAGKKAKKKSSAAAATTQKPAAKEKKSVRKAVKKGGAPVSTSAHTKRTVKIREAGVALRPSVRGKDHVFGVLTGRTDDRINISTALMKTAPYMAICKVRAQFPGSPKNTFEIGTAWYVSSNVLLTAGHVVYQDDLGGKATSVKLWSPQVGAWIDVEDYDATADWKNHGYARRDRDFAAIKTDVASGYFIPLLSMPDAQLRASGVSVCGYPGDRKAPGGTAPVMVVDTANNCKTSPSVIEYTVDTMPGESGGPVLTEFSNGLVVALGIHNYGDEEAKKDRNGALWGRMNYATRITKNVEKEIAAWISGL